jgi:hypothetical protein
VVCNPFIKSVYRLGPDVSTGFCGLHHVGLHYMSMSEANLLIPVIPATAIAATCCYSVMTSRTKMLSRRLFVWFLMISVATYAYFFTVTHGYPPRSSYSEALASIFAAFSVSFLFPLLIVDRRTQPTFFIPCALLGSAVACVTAVGSTIFLILLYFLLGIVKDS